MKRIFLYATAILFVCAMALFVLTTHSFEPRKAAPAVSHQRVFSQFAP
ncbi:MAG: hypothetical protein IJX91_00830 [Clostridia bacterium]|nr:hypothetical protein [Clostridia bacterium]